MDGYKLITGGLVAGFIATVAFVTFNHYGRTMNLEPNAVPSMNNNQVVIKTSKPFIKNYDLDNNGKYESYLFFKKNNAIHYQEIQKDSLENIVLVGDVKKWE